MFLIGEQGALKGLVLSFDEGEEWILGRDPNQSTYVLEEPSVAAKAARISKTSEDLFFIENLGEANTLQVNGRQITEPLLLSEGDLVQLGDTTFRFSQEERSSPSRDAYDDLFSSMEDPELPPEPEPLEEQISEEVSRKDREHVHSKKQEDLASNAYDTIFEDLGEDSELPFHITPEQTASLILKVIAGPNAGAEIGLEKGREYLIGKDPNSCDIVFNDLSVSRTHARLIVSSEGILEIEDLGSKNGTVMNGAKIAEKSVISAQTLVQMGTTIFLIVDREAVQETIYSPPLWHREEEQEEGEPQPESGEEEMVAQQPEDWKNRKIPRKNLVYAASFAVMFFIITLTFFSLFKSESIEVVHKAPHEHLKAFFAKIPSVHYSYNPASGKLFLSGHLLTNVSHQELLYDLEQMPMISSLEDTIVVDETVWRMMNDLLASNPNWRAVSVFSSEPGAFVARGYVANMDQATQLANFFTANFPYLDRLKNGVSVEEVMSAKILSLLQVRGFGTVAPLLMNGELVLSGRYSEQESTAYKDLLKNLSQVEGVLVVKNVAVPVSPEAATINISEQYKVSGTVFHDKAGYNAIVNGRILKVGEILDGMKLVSIKQDTILLEKDGLRYKIDYVQ